MVWSEKFRRKMWINKNLCYQTLNRNQKFLLIKGSNKCVFCWRILHSSQLLSITSVLFSLSFKILLVPIFIELLKIICSLRSLGETIFTKTKVPSHRVTLLKRLHSSWSSQCLPKIEFVQKYCESWGYGTRASNIRRKGFYPRADVSINSALLFFLYLYKM